jgi:hypothetical protein
MVKDLTRFWSAMIYKLRKNVHKGKWENVDLPTSFSMLLGEVDELRLAIEEGSYAEVLLEGADSANMAMIITSVALNSFPLGYDGAPKPAVPPSGVVSRGVESSGATDVPHKALGYPKPKGGGAL